MNFVLLPRIPRSKVHKFPILFQLLPWQCEQLPTSAQAAPGTVWDAPCTTFIMSMLLGLFLGVRPSFPLPVFLFSLTFSIPLFSHTWLQAFFLYVLRHCLSHFVKTFCSHPASWSLEIICWKNGKEARKCFRLFPCKNGPL